MAHTALVAVLLLAATVWLGGLVTLALVARAARRTVRPADRVAFFRALGRGYGLVAGLALLIGLASGAVLLSGRSWTPTTLATVVVAVLLVIGTVAGVIQARRLTRLRARALTRTRGASDDDDALPSPVPAAARRAVLLRATIGGLSLTLVVLGAMSLR